MAVNEETVQITTFGYSETSELHTQGECDVPKQITSAEPLPVSLLFQSETQLWAIHYSLLSRAAELHNMVQRHFITSTSRLLRHGSLSRTASKTPSKCLL
jgi:hypothetical protein